MLSMQAADRPQNSAPSAAGLLNAVIVTGQQMEAALAILAALPAHLRAWPAAQALALQAYASEAGFEDHASAAFHARVTALAKWTAAHDPERQSDARSVLEAAARFPLSESETGIGFDAAGFQELVLFIDELPW